MDLIEWVIVIAIILFVASVTGILGPANQVAVFDAISPIVVLKGSHQYCIQFPEQCNVTIGNHSSSNVTIGNGSVVVATETPFHITNTYTPLQTVTIEPTLPQRYVDPFMGGERWQGMWFKWQWKNASGLQDANRGIIVYGHSYHDVLNQWDPSWGNYKPLLPSPGMRWLAIYVHEEDFGPDDDGLWGYQWNYFNLQYNGVLHQPYNNFNKALYINEIESRHPDLYNIDYVIPFGTQRTFIRHTNMNAESHESINQSNTTNVTAETTVALDFSGYHAEDLFSLRKGAGNAWDGYLLYQVPISITDNDIRIVGNFAGQGVNWRFDDPRNPSVPYIEPTIVPMPVKYSTPVPTPSQIFRPTQEMIRT